MAKNKSSQAKLYVNGMNAKDVTGSFSIITYKDETMAIDCGIYQGNSKLKTYQVNRSMFKDVSLKSIGAVVCSHLNADHILGLPIMVNQGGNATTYMVDGSYPIAELMFKDSLKIHTADCDYLSKKFGKEHTMLFNEEDVERALYNIIESPYNKKTRINQYMEIEFIPAGHIYLSAQVIIYIEDGKYKRKVLASGDLGNVQLDKPLVEPFVPVKSVNCCLVETTYAMADNNSTPMHKNKDLELLSNKIRKTCGFKGGKVLIGIFALQRSLDVLIDLYKVWEKEPFDYPVYLDSPLAVQILEIMERQTSDPIFEKLNRWSNLRYISEYSVSKTVLYSAESCVILASSGFAQGGRILTYFTQILPHKKNCLITVGYSSPDSNMGKVKQRLPITIMHEGKLNDYDVNCDIVELKSFSSHMQSDDMLDYYSSIQCETVVLNHGESKGKYEFAEALSEELGKKCKTTKVVIPMQGDFIVI